MSEEKGGSDVVAALAGLVGASELGYRLTDNPEGFVLAVVYDAIVGFLQGLANEAAFRIDQIWTILTDVVVGGLFAALGMPGRLLGQLVLDLIDTVNGIAADLAGSAGPVAFLAIPAAWSIVLLGSVALLVGIWEAYKWIRVVVA